MTLFDQKRIGFPCFAGRVIGPHGLRGTELLSFTVLLTSIGSSWCFAALHGSTRHLPLFVRVKFGTVVEGARASSHAKLRQHPL